MYIMPPTQSAAARRRCQSKRQDDDNLAHNPERAELTTGSEASEECGGEGWTPLSTREVEGLPHQHTNVGQQEDEERGQREAPLEALLYLPVDFTQFLVVFCDRQEDKNKPGLGTNPEHGAKFDKGDHDDVKQSWAIDLSGI